MSSRPLVNRTVRALAAALRLRCPVCGVGRLFDGWFRMAPACPACGVTREREEGFFTGSIYVGYLATLGIGAALYMILGWWLGWFHRWLAPLFSLYLLGFPFVAWRWARSLWMAVDQIVDPQLPGNPAAARRGTGDPPRSTPA